MLFKLESIARETFGERTSRLIVSNAYRHVCNNNLIYYRDGELLSIANEMNNHVSHEVVEKLDAFFNEIGIVNIRSILYELLSNNDSKSFIESSNNYISELANDLLEIDGAGHIVMDFGSGTGNFLANIYKKAHKNKFVLKDLMGIEINI